MLLRRMLTGSAFLLAIAAVGGFLFLRSIGMFASAPIYQTESGAIDGYDVVAYFTQSAPIKGKAQFSHTYRDATWLFASAENRALFSAEPEKYVPQYGGYCAYAVSQNYTAYADPLAWQIVDGRLFLNFDSEVAKKWQAKQADFIAAADHNWPAVLGNP